ncbi:hypothetical protein [Microbacterium sp. MMO-10]|uniref:hypothetical protein n=1 Tax=Microbacterium sp. MMO-10 TaxID=3081272 RepID=UPI003017AB12
MSRAEHTYRFGELAVLLIVPEGVIAPRWLEVKQADEVVRLRHEGVRNLRAPAKRKPAQAAPLRKIPEDWLPPEGEAERAQLAAPSVNIEFETAQFVDWALSKGEARADWLAAWRGWIRRTHKQNVEKGWKPRAQSAPVGEDPRARWCREHGVTIEEYEARKGDREWLERIKRRGVQA